MRKILAFFGMFPMGALIFIIMILAIIPAVWFKLDITSTKFVVKLVVKPTNKLMGILKDNPNYPFPANKNRKYTNN